MVADEHKNGIVEIRLLFCRFNECFESKIGIPECIELGIIFKTVFTQAVIRKLHLVKWPDVFGRYGIRTMVIGRLYDGEKGFFFFF